MVGFCVLVGGYQSIYHYELLQKSRYISGFHFHLFLFFYTYFFNDFFVYIEISRVNMSPSDDTTYGSGPSKKATVSIAALKLFELVGF